MKLKKYSYLLALLLALVLGINNTYAAEIQEKVCYYMMPNRGEDFKATLTLKWGGDDNGWGDYIEDFAQVRVDAVGGAAEFNTEPLLNWIDVYDFLGITSVADQQPTADGSPELGFFYEDISDVEEMTSEPDCPEYLIFELDGWWWWDHYNVWGTDSKTKAEQAVKAAESTTDYTVYYASFKDDNGNEYTDVDYYGEYIELGLINLDDAGNIQCEDLFGDENDPDSLHSMINMVMNYVRIIVPILIILMGSIDLAKAVIAGKEDNMKKAQTDFMKRVIMGVAVFFVPLLVNLMMNVINDAWQGEIVVKVCDTIIK